MKRKYLKYKLTIISILLFNVFILSGCNNNIKNIDKNGISSNVTIIKNNETLNVIEEQEIQSTFFNFYNIPEYKGISYYEINNNIPFFSEEEKNTEIFEIYADLDEFGRCQTAYANICKDLMPVEERGEIGHIKPSGWHSVKYPEVINDLYLYNRCHLIGFQLAGENDNEKNLIAGTRYMNVEGMLPFENQVDDYVEATNNHVLYRVTPIYDDKNLVASGVLMEAWSVEDNGRGICFNVYCYNVQPGIVIDYKTGDSRLEQDVFDTSINSNEADYVINTNTLKIHLPNCESVMEMSGKNKSEYYGTKEELESSGYTTCKICNP